MYWECHDLREHLDKACNGRSEALEAFSQSFKEAVYGRNKKM